MLFFIRIFLFLEQLVEEIGSGYEEVGGKEDKHYGISSISKDLYSFKSIYIYIYIYIILQIKMYNSSV